MGSRWDAESQVKGDITVVIAARNVEVFVGETIGSIRAADFTNWRMIVIVDSATDGTAAIARTHAVEDPRIEVFEGQYGGVSAARNAGLERCQTRFVIFVDGDDLMLPESLGRFVEALASPSAPVAAVATHIKIEEDGDILPSETSLERPGFPEMAPWPELLQRNIIVNGGTIAMRTDMARAVGGFDPGLEIGEDWEFWVRLALEGPFVSVGSHPSMLYRQRRNSAMLRADSEFDSLQMAALDKIFTNASLLRLFNPQKIAKLRRQATIDMQLTRLRAIVQMGHYHRAFRKLTEIVWSHVECLWQPYVWQYLLRQIRPKFSPRTGGRLNDFKVVIVRPKGHGASSTTTRLLNRGTAQDMRLQSLKSRS